MPPMTRGGFSNLLAPGYRKIFFETYKERSVEGSKLVNMKTSKRAYEEDFPIAGFGTLLQKGEGESITYQDAIQGVVKRYVWTTYGLGFRVTQEMFEDDLYGIFGNKMSRALGRSARNNFEIVAHAPFNNAFNTSFIGFEAGKSLCSLTHATLRGGTIANRPAADTDITLLALQAAIEHFDGLTDESGLPMMLQPKLLVHSSGDQWIVGQLLKSAQLPGGNQNDKNMLQGLLTPHLSHFLTDVDSWFVLADEHDVNYHDRRQVTFGNTDDFDTGDAKYKVTRRNGAGFGDWRGVYGSPGA